MQRAKQPKPEIVTAATPTPIVWVLAQVSPFFEVLAASKNRGQLVSEMAELYGADKDGGSRRDLRFAIRPTNLLFG